MKSRGSRRRAGSLASAAAAMAIMSLLAHAPAQAEAAPAPSVSAETLAALAPLAEEIGVTRKLVVHAEPLATPELVFADDQGHETSIAAFRGKIVLLNFWATFCAPCLEEMPALNALEERLGGEAFQVVAVNVDASEERARAWLRTHEIDRLSFHRDASMRSAVALGAPGMPLTLLIDRSGFEVARLVGAAAWDEGAAPAAINLLIDGR